MIFDVSGAAWCLAGTMSWRNALGCHVGCIEFNLLEGLQ